MKPNRFVATVMFIALFLTVPSSGQAPTAPPLDGSSRLDELERTVRLLQQELAGLRSLLKVPKPYEDTERFQVAIGDSPTLGSQSATVAIIEYSDFQCPFCARHANTTMLGLRQQYIDSGKVLYVFRHLPIENLHPLAIRAGQAAECAGE